MVNSAKAGRIFDALLDAGGAISGVLLVVVMLVTSVKVFFRYVLQEGLIGVDQLSGTLLLWVTFFGAAWVLRRDEHVTVDLLITHLGPTARRWLTVVNSLICAALCLTLTYFGTLEVIESVERGILIPAEIEIPRVVNLYVIPLGCLFLLLQFIRRARLAWRGKAAGATTTIHL